MYFYQQKCREKTRNCPNDRFRLIRQSTLLYKKYRSLGVTINNKSNFILDRLAQTQKKEQYEELLDLMTYSFAKE